MMLAGVLQEVRREIVGHSSQHSRDVNDRYSQIGLGERTDAIRKLEVWIASQAASLDAETMQQAPRQPTPTTQPCRSHPMAEPKTNNLDQAVRKRILARATEINQKLLVRLEAAAIDLNNNRHLAALGGLDGLEREIDDMRSFLLLLR